jgi:hypothetical protein
MNSIPRPGCWNLFCTANIHAAEIKSNKEMLRAVFFSIMNVYRIECELLKIVCWVVLTRRFHQYTDERRANQKSPMFMTSYKKTLTMCAVRLTRLRPAERHFYGAIGAGV